MAHTHSINAKHMNESSCVAFEMYFFLLLNILFLVGDKARHIISTKRHDMTDRSCDESLDQPLKLGDKNILIGQALE